MFNSGIYKDIELLGNMLDSLCEKYPDMYPDSFRKQTFLLKYRFGELSRKLGEAIIKSMGMTMSEFAKSISPNTG